ncbi:MULTISPECIES: hypothetical protein [Bacillus cereus group]|uniref:Uncharacterized protein n=2 Tax=Bacillus cereus group TaxID=86661 RepID=A0A9W7UNK9_BACCE|nr:MULTISPECIES: hypothetical protein [Bacillus cereus group]KAA6448419.1 hypothetical protein DX932_30715 [Bacillus cereus]MEB9673271.1 hypothetical protein [Bacillus anthracis]OTW50754.1 hypothetical protein BK699_09375 [Bacillus thuringiensis serovar mexicanensis]OTX09439.1 hypothetical protein BK705_04420 [Bacillus thuringiensis serovar monterrey]PEQ70168.1 hypothetical protein CN474_18555 [Bacillus thuringiensis]
MLDLALNCFVGRKIGRECGRVGLMFGLILIGSLLLFQHYAPYIYTVYSANTVETILKGLFLLIIAFGTLLLIVPIIMAIGSCFYLLIRTVVGVLKA